MIVQRLPNTPHAGDPAPQEAKQRELEGGHPRMEHESTNDAKGDSVPYATIF